MPAGQERPTTLLRRAAARGPIDDPLARAAQAVCMNAATLHWLTPWLDAYDPPKPNPSAAFVDGHQQPR